jgi:membrane associated rhomboid family serine protease
MIRYTQRPLEGGNKGMFIPVGTNLRLKKIPYATIGLLFVNWCVYVFTHGLYYKTEFVIWRYFYLLPGEAYPWQLVTSMFFHIDFWHVFGNSIFLGVFGIFVEDKVGWKQYLFLYFLTGIAAGLVHSAMTGLFMRDELLNPGLGASGAIAGIMGVFLYRCYYAKVRILLFFFIPLQVPAWLLLGFFFLRDFTGGIAAIKGIHQNTAFWAHVGGFLGGFATSKYLKYEGQAKREKLEHTVRKRLDTHEGFAEGMMAAEELIQTDAENPYLHLKMAQAKSRGGNSKEGKEHYEKTLQLMLETDREKAVEVFVEYWKKYLTVMEPRYQVRISRLLNRAGHPQLARATLEALINSAYPLDPSMDTAYLNLASLYEQQFKQYDISRAVYQKYLQKFPQTEHRAFVEKKIRALQGGVNP